MYSSGYRRNPTSTNNKYLYQQNRTATGTANQVLTGTNIGRVSSAHNEPKPLVTGNSASGNSAYSTKSYDKLTPSAESDILRARGSNEPLKPLSSLNKSRNNLATPETRDSRESTTAGSSKYSKQTRSSSSNRSSSKSRKTETPSSSSGKEDEIIVIHVCDENRKVNKDFKCGKTLLLSHMKYFEKFLSGNSSFEDIDISVHCDVQIFEWLMQYLNKSRNGAQPVLEVNNVISILISSDFLQMEALVEECVGFVKNRLAEVVKLPIDMNCLNSKLLGKIGTLITAEELDSIRDRKDKLVSKLFTKKLEALLEDENSTLYRCVYCRKLFTNQQRDWMVCHKAKIFIDFHGSVIAQHVADRSWEPKRFIYFLRLRNMTWKEIYWKIWARLQTLYCTVCEEYFVASELGHCSYHPMGPKFTYGSNTGVFPCCNSPAVRFDTNIRKQGCCARNHVIKPNSQETQVLDLIMKKYSVIAEPFVPPNQMLDKTGSSQQADKTASGEKPKSESLQIMLNKFMAEEGEDDVNSEDDEYDSPGSEKGVVSESESESDESDDDDGKKKKIVSTMASTTASVTGNNSTSGPTQSRQKKKRSKSKKKKADATPMNPLKQRQWRLDRIRNQDRDEMMSLVKKLNKMRKEGKPEKKSERKTDKSAKKK